MYLGAQSWNLLPGRSEWKMQNTLSNSDYYYRNRRGLVIQWGKWGYTDLMKKINKRIFSAQKLKFFYASGGTGRYRICILVREDCFQIPDARGGAALTATRDRRGAMRRRNPSAPSSSTSYSGCEQQPIPIAAPWRVCRPLQSQILRGF